MLKIESIKISNFKCFSNAEICFDDDEVSVYGDNETGKSSIFDAFCWCLFGKDSQGNSNFSIIPTYSTNVCESRVEINFKINEKPKKLCRKYSPKFNKKNEFIKYETVCEINDIVKGVREYENEINMITNENVFNILSNPRYFMEQINPSKGLLSWQERRKRLFQLCDEINDDEIISCNSDYEWIAEELSRYNNVEEILYVYKKKSNSLNNSIQETVIRIDQQSKNFNTETLDTTEINKKNAELELKKENNINQQKIFSKNSSLESEIYEIKEEIETKKNEYLRQMTEFNNTEKEKISKKMQEIESKNKIDMEIYHKLNKEYNTKNQKLSLEFEKIKSKVNETKFKISNLRQEYKKTKTLKVCSQCNRPFDNNTIATKLKDISYDGKILNEELNKYEMNMETIKNELKNLNQPNYPELESLSNINPKSFENNVLENEILNLKSKVRIKELEMEKEKENKSILKLKIELEEIEKSIFENYSKLEIIKQTKYTNEILNVLKKSLEKYKSEVSDTERKIEILLNFIQSKNEMLEQKINEKFEMVKWKLFYKTKLDELTKETCIPIINGREYMDMSESTKTICGLEIIKTFQKHYDIYLPIFIDNAEGINSNLAYNTQTIKLYVKPENCPVCGENSGRRNEKMDFVCKNCGKAFSKSITILGGEINVR